MNDHEFIDFTSEQLAANESFQAYVFRQREADIIFWTNFIRSYPQKRVEIEEAVEILSLVTFKKNKLTPQVKEMEFTRLITSISLSQEKAAPMQLQDKRKTSLAPDVRRRFLPAPLLMRMAAALAGLLLLFSAALYLAADFLRSGTTTYQTSYGENATHILPDSSVVILNGNTKIFYRDAWDGNSVREVWLDGEAFFEVKHKGKSKDARFVVHTPGMDVEVLGTKFNVFNRDDRANVILNSGKVKVRIGSVNDTSSVVMQPDEVVEYFRKDQTMVRKHVNAEVLTSWRNKKLVFDNTPLYKIREIIEYNYGVKVKFSKNVDINESLVGTIPSDNLDVLLTVLAKSSNLQITRNEDEIIVDKKNPVSVQP